MEQCKICFQKKKSFGIRKCYRCGDLSHIVEDCTFKENTETTDNILILNKKWIKKENSLNCLLGECYNIFNFAKSSIVKPIAKWVNKVL